MHASIKEPTRVGKTSSTIIDNFLTTISKTDYQTCVIDPGISDHNAQIFVTNFEYLKPGKVNVVSKKNRKYNAESIDLFKKALSTKDWNELYRLDDVNKCCDKFIHHLKCSFNLAFPLQDFKHKKSKPNKWITRGILVSRSNLRVLADNKKLNTGKAFQQYFKNYKRIYRRVLRAAKALHNNERVQKAACKNKEMWKVVKEIENGIEINSGGKKLLQLVLEDKSIVTNEEDMVEKINEFFVTVGIKNSTIGDYTAAEKYCSDVINNVHTLFLKPVTSNELSILIRTLPNKFTEGPDGLPCKIVKSACDEIVKPLSFLINLSYDKGRVPDSLKQTRVAPIQKKKDSYQINDFRPISINSFLSTINKKAAHKQILNFLNERKLIS